MEIDQQQAPALLQPFDLEIFGRVGWVLIAWGC